MLIRANTPSRVEIKAGLNDDYNKRRIRDGKRSDTKEQSLEQSKLIQWTDVEE